jgi:hypothetical protein
MRNLEVKYSYLKIIKFKLRKKSVLLLLKMIIQTILNDQYLYLSIFQKLYLNKQIIFISK